MNLKSITFLTLILSFFSNFAYAQSQFDEKLRDKAYNFCPQNNYDSTEAYMETKEFKIGVCSNPQSNYNPQIDTCYEPFYYFIVIESKEKNQTASLPTKIESNKKYYPNAIYTFKAQKNGVIYQVQTTGGSNSYNPDDFKKHFTSFSITKNNKVIYQQRVNYYFGPIGKGC